MSASYTSSAFPPGLLPVVLFTVLFVAVAVVSMSALSPKCPIDAESGFGPVADCYDGFDFTLLFEESILTIVPAGITLILLPWFISRLGRSDRKVVGTWHLVAKPVRT